MKVANNKKARALAGVKSYHVIEKQHDYYYLMKVESDGSIACFGAGSIKKTAKGYTFEWRDPFDATHKSFLKPNDWEIEI